MAVPVGWDSTYEPLCGENDPYGRSDTANKYAKMLWANFTAEHNKDDGSHKTRSLQKVEEGTYTGSGSGQTIALSDSSLQIEDIMIVVDYAVWPVIRSTSMANTQELGSTGLAANKITDISTTGEFTVGTDDTVDKSGETYYYTVWGA